MECNSFDVDGLTLEHDTKPGLIRVNHPKLSEPMLFESVKLKRWLLRLLRESTFAEDQPRTPPSGDDR